MENKETVRFYTLISIIVLLVLTLGSPAVASLINDYDREQNGIDVFYRGEKINLISKPFIQDEVVYVPLREIFNLGGVADEDILWYEGTVTITARPTQAEVYLGSYDCYVNDMAVRLIEKAQLKDDKTYVSVDFLKVFDIGQADLGGNEMFNHLKIFYKNSDLIAESRISNINPNDILLDADDLNQDMIDAYKNKIIQIYELNTAYSDYFLYDIDNDNLMELFIGWRTMRVYTFKNNSLHRLGDIYNEAYKLEGEAGIYTYGGFGTGVGGTAYYEIQSDRLVLTEGQVKLQYGFSISDGTIFNYNDETISEEDYNHLVATLFNESNRLGVNKNNVNQFVK